MAGGVTEVHFLQTNHVYNSDVSLKNNILSLPKGTLIICLRLSDKQGV